MQDLIHGAISLSGSFISSFTHMDKKPRIYAKRLAEEFNCDNDNPDVITRCLQKVPALDLARKTDFFLQFPWIGPVIWLPIVDNFSSNPILPIDPMEALTSGSYTKVSQKKK